MELRSQILELIRSTVRSMVEDAQIILFGSRARGTNRDDSDWDVLVLVDSPKLSALQSDIDYELWQRGLDYGQQINTIVRTTEQWNNNPSLFKYNVTKDGIRL